jgi:hypothetical protein
MRSPAYMILQTHLHCTVGPYLTDGLMAIEIEKYLMRRWKHE